MPATVCLCSSNESSCRGLSSNFLIFFIRKYFLVDKHINDIFISQKTRRRIVSSIILQKSMYRLIPLLSIQLKYGVEHHIAVQTIVERLGAPLRILVENESLLLIQEVYSIQF